MNPRTFSEHAEYRWSVFFTYAFDPIFFERLVLRDLARGGSHGVLVLADGAELERGFERVASELRALGRSYVLARSRSDAGPFHPKIFLRLGRTGGLAWVGSGNLTLGGWGTNHELATAWRVGPEAADAGGWIGPLLRRALAWTEAPLAHAMLHRMLALDWVRAPRPGQELPLLLSDEGVLARQLEARWRGRRFTTLDVLTGSTDRTGRMLRWAQDAFGVERVRLAVEPGRMSFDQAGLADLPLELHLVDTPGAASSKGPARPLHAKLYWFDGPDGPGAVVGSPNCSAAGWLVPWRTAGGAKIGMGRGNLEAALIYDRPESEAFAPVLQVFEGDGEPAAVRVPVHQEGTGEARADADVRYRMATLQVEPDRERLVLTFEAPGPAADAEVTLHWPRGQVALAYEADADGVWSAPVPETLILTRAVVARAAVRGPDEATGTAHGTHWTPPLWLDLPAQLERALIGGGYHAPLDELARPTTRSDNAVLDELRRIGAELLGDAPEFLDPLTRPGRRRGSMQDGDTPAPTQWTDPNRLIHALDDQPMHAEHPLRGSSGASLGIHGIFRAIFGDEPDDAEDPEDPEAAALGPDDEETDSLGSDLDTGPTGSGGGRGTSGRRGGEDGSRPTEEDGPAPDAVPPVRARDKRRFERDTERILEEFGKREFAQRCTPRQLQMAAAFPVVAALRGLPRGFTDAETTMAWTREVINRLLFDHGDTPALLDTVVARYRALDDLDGVERALGDGVLWVTLSAALCLLPWSGPGAALHRAVLLRELWGRDILRAQASPERIHLLARRYRAGPAVEALRELAAPAASCLQELEARLPPHHPGLWTDPDFERAPIQQGDVLWSPKAGWAVALEPEHASGDTAKVLVYWVREGRATPFVVEPYWVPVRQVADCYPELAPAHAALIALLDRIERRTVALMEEGA
jgi:hypothetical protein